AFCAAGGYSAGDQGNWGRNRSRSSFFAGGVSGKGKLKSEPNDPRRMADFTINAFQTYLPEKRNWGRDKRFSSDGWKWIVVTNIIGHGHALQAGVAARG